MNKKMCIICGKPLNDGIIINGRGICRKCEKRIVSCPMDTDFYEYYRICIKRVLQKCKYRGVNLRCQNYHL